MAEAQATLPERPRAGEIVEGYELLGLLAGGGMGEVHLVRRRRAGGFDKRLAMKVMHPHLASDPGMIAMFLDEARIASLVAHPNVVEVVDTGTHRGLPWLVMELIDGRSLAEVVLEQPSDALLAHVLARAAHGLHAAHEAADQAGRPLHIVHRDVSPQNVLVALDGRVKVVDFGIAAARGRLAHTATGELKGKTGYLAPEQIAHRGGVDRRADVWAFGVMAWECFARRPLFDGETASARMRQVETMAIPDLRELVSGIDPELASGIAACLERDPSARASTLQPIAQVLARVGAAGGCAGSDAIEAWMRARFASRVRAPDVESDQVTAREGAPRETAVAGGGETSAVRARSRAGAGRGTRIALGAIAVAAAVGIASAVAWRATLSSPPASGRGQGRESAAGGPGAGGGAGSGSESGARSEPATRARSESPSRAGSESPSGSGPGSPPSIVPAAASAPRAPRAPRARRAAAPIAVVAPGPDPAPTAADAPAAAAPPPPELRLQPSPYAPAP
jgi:hypothetical protein